MDMAEVKITAAVTGYAGVSNAVLSALRNSAAAVDILERNKANSAYVITPN